VQQEVPVAAATAAAAGSSLQHVRGQAQAALQVEQQVQTQVIPEITTDLFGAVSPVDEQAIKEGVFENKDGHRWVACWWVCQQQQQQQQRRLAARAREVMVFERNTHAGTGHGAVWVFGGGGQQQRPR
jgi:hypothetical protein